ncbi:alpha/beta hydrolase [Nocardiopsis sp. EMB25]|uniref:alpha/beta fold hydrolase n=1 Tax=Nocardiopsis sp. EMB25 TaxID=2835867 RepID=UPI002283ABA2|nr:alpha/beta hydrolase [Nocardiopsis sp. EMB25]MCY9785378.1 alpha/beta hydrolase [Nocardiopsis sp. EMB25]
MARITIGRTSLGYEEKGTGSPVVLVHAAVGDRSMWDHQFEALARRHRVVRYDWRGYGESDDTGGPVAHYEDLLALMDALGIGRAALVGASMGGGHAVDAALVAPERVTGLALVCAGMTGREWPGSFTEAAGRAMAGAVPKERLARYREGHADPDPADVAAMAQAQARFVALGPRRGPEDLPAPVWERILELYRTTFHRMWSGPPTTMRSPEPPAEGRLAEIGVPTLVVRGGCDVPEIREVSDLYAAGVPGARLVELPDAGHLPSVERPEELTEVLGGFLTEAAPSS